MADPIAFDDFYLRPNLKSTGMVPANGPYTQCPDIYPSGNMPINDFSTTLATDESYNKDLSSNVMLNYDNYIYVRGKNGSNSAVTKRIELYYAPSQVINWPCKWYGNKLKTASEQSYVTVTNVDPGNVAVGSECFIWPSVPKPPVGSDHYCLIANVNDSANSHPVPGTQGMTYEDMADLVKNDLRIGWKNVVLVEKDTPTFTFSQVLDIPQDVQENKTVRISLVCPTEFAGAAVQFTSSTSQGSSGPIQLEKTVIPKTKGSAVLGVEVDLAPGFKSSIQVNYWSNGITPVSGKTIQLDASYKPSTQEEFDSAVNKNIVCPKHAKLMNSFKGKNHTQGIVPYTPIQIGSMIYKFI